ncbi:cell surface protein [Candidatus Woesearchaeota archaeon]|nr:cell surface protein [Candidatus Woesearchaeota archaeon]
METALKPYLEKSVEVLRRYNLIPEQAEDYQLATLLEQVQSVDEPRVVAIAKTVRLAGVYNRLVSNNISDMRFGQRYADVQEMFDSIRNDTSALVEQLQDGKLDLGERVQNWWMRLARGTPHKRFEKIKDIYQDVTTDTGKQLEMEKEIIDGYVNFRFALKEAEIAAHQVLATQTGIWDKSKLATQTAAAKVDNYAGADKSEKSRLELSRDEALYNQQQEERKYQLLKDVAEHLTISYNVGEALVAKLSQSNRTKDQLHTRAITFFGTNANVLTTLDAIYASLYGLHETTQTINAMEEGINKGIEQVATLGRDLEKAAVEAGYGKSLSSDAVQKLVDSIVAYHTETARDIDRLREESTNNANEIERIVEDGKRRTRNAILHATAGTLEQKTQ